jgi:type VI secretion system Hcp family effector
MQWMVQFSSTTRSLGRGKGQLRGMAYGSRTITPRNFSQMLLGIASQTGGLSGSGGKGKGSTTPFVIVKKKDSSSPLLFQMCCTAETQQSLDLNFIRPGGSGGKEQVVSRITLTNATIAKYNQFHNLLTLPKPKHPKTLNTRELEEIELTFQDITLTNVFNSKSARDDWTS